MIEKNEQYKIIDDYLSIEEYENCWEFVSRVATYMPGEKDHHNSYPIGMVSELSVEHGNTFMLFPKHMHGSKLSRMYVNYYSPRELSVFHIDSAENHYSRPSAWSRLAPKPTNVNLAKRESERSFDREGVVRTTHASRNRRQSVQVDGPDRP